MGWPAGPRGPGSRSLDSTRRSDVRPGRPGELAAGGSQAGAWSSLPGRCARCAEPHLEQNSPETDTGTGERRARKLACGVRGRAGGKGLFRQHLACGLSYFCVFCETKEDAQAVIETLDGLARHSWADALDREDAHRPSGRGLRLPRLHDPAVSFGTLQSRVPDTHHAEQDIHQGTADHTRCGLEATHWRPVSAVLRALNPVIRGWANYFRIAIASKVFSALDNWMFLKAVRWVNRTHPA